MTRQVQYLQTAVYYEILGNNLENGSVQNTYTDDIVSGDNGAINETEFSTGARYLGCARMMFNLTLSSILPYKWTYN